MAEIKLPQYQITSLPSGGIPYPPNWEIFIEPYRFEVSSTVGYASLTSKRFYNQITNGVYCNFPKKWLTLADVLFLGVARKLVSVDSDKVTLQATCPACLQKVDPTLSLKDAIKFKASPIKNRDKYPVKATFSEHIGWFKILTADDYIDLFARNEDITPAERLAKATYKLVKINKKGEEEILHSLEEPDTFKDPNAAVVIPNRMKYEDIAKIYGEFIGRDAEILEKLLDIFEPAELEPITIKCTNKDCEHEFQRVITQEELTRVLQPFRPKTRGVPEDFIDL